MIGLFSGGTSGDPDAQAAAGGLVLEQTGEGLLLQDVEGFGVPEKARDPDEQFVGECLHFVFIITEIGDVFVQGLYLVECHALFDPADDRIMLVQRKVVARAGPDQGEDLLKRLDGFFFELRRRLDDACVGALRIAQQEFRHLVRRKDIVDEPGCDGGGRHTVIFCCFHILGQHKPAFALDRAQAERALRARAGQDHADGTLALVLCKGTEKEVDGVADAVVCRGLEQMEPVALDGHVPVRGDDVHPVRHDPHALLSLRNLHCGMPLQELRHDALAFGGKVGYQDEGHAAVRRHVAEEQFQRLESAGGRPDTDDVEGISASPGRSWSGGNRRRGLRNRL
jgi:hypothetical protein